MWSEKALAVSVPKAGARDGWCSAPLLQPCSASSEAPVAAPAVDDITLQQFEHIEAIALVGNEICEQNIEPVVDADKVVPILSAAAQRRLSHGKPRGKSDVSSAARMSRWAKRELLRAMLTPVEKIGSTNRPASPTNTKRSPESCFIA